MKILHVIDGLGTGGAEKDIVNWYRNIDRNKYQFDFLIRSCQYFYVDEIRELGGKVFQVAPFPAEFLKNYYETKKFFKKHSKEYNAVHVHGNALIYIVPLYLAKRYGIKIRIMHVHSTKTKSRIGTVMHLINRRFIQSLATKCIACSYDAGVFGFGKEFHIIRNGIDLKKFILDKDSIRQKYRSKFNIDRTTIVLGHVGRFLPVKNHSFIIECYQKMAERRKIVLFLVGDGPLRIEIEKDILQNNIKGVFLLGESNDTPELLNFFDIMIFPSLYEGVPLVPLEAQASSTKIICSDAITDEICITPYVRRLSIKKSAEEWAEYTINFYDEKLDDRNVCKEFADKNYNIEKSVKELEKLYNS